MTLDRRAPLLTPPTLPLLPLPSAGPIPDLSQCVKLEELHLHENLFDGPIPDSLLQCTRLKSLTLVKNCLEGAPLHLDMDRCKIFRLSQGVRSDIC